MRLVSLLVTGCACAALNTAAAHAAEAAPTAESSAVTSADIVVTARKRNETLLDVPVAVSAVTGDALAKRNINSVREAAVLAPGLNISSDGAGRAFVSIRGVGTTLVQTVQPGVGLFIDGIYRPNTAYLNNPLLDVDRIEVLRGPQGTLYGKNTLGGAINVITRQPSNTLEARGSASYAGPDDSWLVSGSVSGPIIKDKLQVRIGASHRQQDGFLNNSVIGGKANKFNTDSLNATVRAMPTDTLTLTINGYYDWVKGTNTPYSRVSGVTDYSRNVEFNSLGTTNYRYRGVNAKIETPIDALDTKVTLLAAYDARNSSTPDSDGDFGPADIARLSGHDSLRTKTVELRFDSKVSDRISTLFGLFYSRETTDSLQLTRIVPFGIVNSATNATKADTYAAFGTVFWKPNSDWEVALGLRYDHENRSAKGTVSIDGDKAARLKSDQVEPRITVTRHWNRDLMSYASISRGYRGGGFNAPTAPVLKYRGDSVWTYEIGTKYASRDRRFTVSGDIFYNDYSHYIGLNSVAPASTGSLVTVDLNSGKVKSYGAELEITVKPTAAWTISGGLTLMHARLTDAGEYTAVTGRTLATDRLTFQPDWMFNISSDYVVRIGQNTLTFNASVNGKGSRSAASLNETTATILKPYALANGSVTYRTGPFEFAVFATNIFNKKYFESYIEKTTLQLAGLPASDLGIVGDRRRYGVRASFRF